jgi:hypothetical protein
VLEKILSGGCMSFIQKHSKEIKKPTPFENLKRLVFDGAVKDGWMHSEIEIEFIQLIGDVKARVKFYSLYDHSLVKVLNVEANIEEGDSLKLPGAIVSYRVEVTGFEGEG